VVKNAKPGDSWAEDELQEEYLIYGVLHPLQGSIIPKMHPDSSRTRLVLEKVRGRTLLEVATSTGTSPYTFGVLLLHACAALSGLHAHGWTHGDSHANNILVWPEGARLIDLSFAEEGHHLPPNMWEKRVKHDWALLLRSFEGQVSAQKWAIAKKLLM
jgi:tRNA A-37 threonylcarbamoyl transferase component Bud32